MSGGSPAAGSRALLIIVRRCPGCPGRRRRRESGADCVRGGARTACQHAATILHPDAGSRRRVRHLTTHAKHHHRRVCHSRVRLLVHGTRSRPTSSRRAAGRRARGDEGSAKVPPQAVAEGQQVGAAASACIVWGPPPTGFVAEDTTLAEGSAAGEDIGAAASACIIWGPTPHGFVAEDTALAEGSAADEDIGTAASACWWWGPTPHGFVANDAVVEEHVVSR